MRVARLSRATAVFAAKEAIGRTPNDSRPSESDGFEPRGAEPAPKHAPGRFGIPVFGIPVVCGRRRHRHSCDPDRRGLICILIAAASVQILEAPRNDADFVTEVVAGERVEVVGESGEWLEVVVPSHATRLDERGYPGWAKPDKLIEAPDWNPTHKITRPNAANLPLGALLEESEGGTRLPNGDTVEVGASETLPIREARNRSPVEISKDLLGLPYRWGGADSMLGMDCSGLVFRVMQTLGVSVPRDADDQFDEAPFQSRGHWREARENDLVFFGTSSITHVGFYLGDGTYISEHGSGGTVVRGMGEDPYCGFARYR